MWTNLILVASPRSQDVLRVFKRFKDVRVQALRTNSRVERLDERVVRRLSWSTEITTHLLTVRPRIQVARNELRTVVDLDHRRFAMRPRQSIEHFNDVAGTEGPMRLRRHSFASVLIDNRQHADLSTIMQLICHEVHAHRSSRRLDDFAASDSCFSSARSFAAYIEPFQAIQPPNSFVIHMPTLAPQKNMHASTSPTRSHRRDLSHAHHKRVLWVANRCIAYHRLLQRSVEHARRREISYATYTCPTSSRRWAGIRFLRRTSCKIALSKLKSATNRLSLGFPSSRCLSLRISVSPIAPNFFFHR